MSRCAKCPRKDVVDLEAMSRDRCFHDRISWDIATGRDVHKIWVLAGVDEIPCGSINTILCWGIKSKKLPPGACHLSPTS